MEEFELLMYPLEEDKFAIGNLCEKLQVGMDEYNMLCKDMNLNESKIWKSIYYLLMDLKKDGYSGASTERPAYKEMMNDVEN